MDCYLYIGFNPVPVIETIRISPVPEYMHGLKFIYACDFHIRDLTKDLYIDRLCDMIKEQNADMLLLGGDYGESTDSTVRLFDRLSQIEFQYGCYGCIGNNDKEAFEGNINSLKKAMHGSLLLDEEKRLNINGGRLVICGVDELKYGSPIMKHRLKNENGSYRILLSHYPHWSPVQPFSNSDLILAGHTHGGQIDFLGLTCYSFMGNRMPCINGMKTYKGTKIVTCPGIGISDLPIRFGVRPKIFVIEF